MSPDRHANMVVPDFRRCDGPLLRAIRSGSWVLLDELNLANQSVLEGLNAVLDHRAEVFIPELGATFRCAPGFRLFAAQNPVQEVRGCCSVKYPIAHADVTVLTKNQYWRLQQQRCIFLALLDGIAWVSTVFMLQGGGRKGLPKSFLNRFTRVHIDLLQTDDLLFIAGEPHMARAFCCVNTAGVGYYAPCACCLSLAMQS